MFKRMMARREFKRARAATYRRLARELQVYDTVYRACMAEEGQC